MLRRSAPTGTQALTTAAWVSLSLAGVACALTLLFLSMRSVMEIGGSCAEGGPYVSARPCPDGVPGAMMLAIFGGLISFGTYAAVCLWRGVPSLLALAWPALFLSLGWNFLEYGIDAPGGGGLAWGWLVCAVVFGLMGGVPLLIALPLTLRAFFRASRQTPPSWATPQRRSAAAPDVPPTTRARAQAAAELLRTLSARAAALSRAPRGANMAASTVAEVSSSTKTEGSVQTRHVAATGDLVERLESLATLHRQGDLSDEEFAAAKRRLIGGTE